MDQNLIFTACPNGYDAQGNLKLSCAIGIQLKPNNPASLNSFQDILSYAEKISNTSFKVYFNQNVVDAVVASDPTLNIGLWQELFHSNIKVRAFETEELNRKYLHSYPVKHIVGFIEDYYTKIAAEKPDRLISAEELVGKDGLGVISNYTFNPQAYRPDLGANSTYRPPRQEIKESDILVKKEDLKNRLAYTLRQNHFIPFSESRQPESDFIQLRDFHKTDKYLKGIKGQLPKVELPDFEFHDMISIISNYPVVQRLLGLVVDLTVPAKNYPGTGTLRAVPQGLLFDETHQFSSPPSAYTLTQNTFIAKPRIDSPIQEGFIKINDGSFTVHQIDADGAAIKAGQLADNKIQQLAKQYVVMTNLSTGKAADLIKNKPKPEDEGLPTLRSAGIALAKNGWSGNLLARFGRDVDFGKTILDKNKMVPQLQVIFPDDTLFTDDLLQGYRMDIAYEDAPDQWFSLHWRNDTYQYRDKNKNWQTIPGEYINEGFIQTAMAQDTDDQEQVYVSENMFRWEGWSLSVPKPGYAINESDEMEGPEADRKDFVHKNQAQEIKKYQVPEEVEFKLNSTSGIVPGTLPRLRFGKAYRVRVRTVDLAGNSLPLETKTTPNNCQISNFIYRRFEPVASPIVQLGNPVRDGESLEMMVIRSNHDQDTSNYENTAGEGFPSTSLRHLLSAKTNQLMVETHGKIELAFQNNANEAKQVYQLITQRDQMDTTPSGQVVNTPVINYLPDPMAAGVALFADESNETKKDFKTGFPLKLFGFFEKNEVQEGYNKVGDGGNEWYNPAPVSIRLLEGSFKTEWNSGKREFVIYLPKGERLKIKFASFWRSEDLEKYAGLWQKLKQQYPQKLTDLKKLAFHGRHWMFSPFRHLELTHATQQPVEAPFSEVFQPQRDFEKSEVYLNTRVKFHGPSSEKLFFTAQWQEPIDDVTEHKFFMKPMSGNSAEVELGYHQSEITKGQIVDPESQQQEGQEDNQSTIQSATIDNQSIKLSKKESKNRRKLNRTGQDRKAVIAKESTAQLYQVQPQALQSNVKINANVANFQAFVKGIYQQFPDTKHRWVDYSVTATSRYKAHFDKLIASKKITTNRDGNVIERVNILSSARPAPPKVDYTIPIFSWQKWQNETIMHHKRNGGGIRVYLQRPWFSTGEDELLGVIVHSPSISDTISGLSPNSQEVTRWASDPILVDKAPLASGPGLQDFRMFERPDWVLHPNSSTRRVFVVGYPVQYDEQRKLWYADLEIRPGNLYFPFVKLALARYQPHSIRTLQKDVCISSIVPVDFTQLVPDRETRIDFRKEDLNTKFTITVRGQIHNSGHIRNVLKISFLDTELAQPYDAVIDTGDNNNRLAKKAENILIGSDHINNGFYQVEREFKLPSRYKKEPFRVIIKEVEEVQTKGNITNLQNAAANKDTSRVIYTDVFNINVNK